MLTEEKHNKINETKQMIHRIHQQQLNSGITNDKHEHKLVQILGGIDEILTVFFQSDSNIIMTQEQINDAYEILSAPTKPQQLHKTTVPVAVNNLEDKGMNQESNVKYTFHDEDTFLFSLFTEQNASTILKAIQSKIVIGFLSTVTVIYIIFFVLSSGALSFNVLPVNAFWVYMSIMNIIYMIYIIFWLLYMNKLALKLIRTQFEVWFKNFYLLQFILSNVAMTYLEINRAPWYHSCTWYLLLTLFFAWVKFFDAVNIRRENKLFISCIAAGLFSVAVLQDARTSYFRHKYTVYTVATIKMFSGHVHVSLIDISYHSAMILAIFMFRQVLLLIMHPNKCLVIRKKPSVKYESINNNVSEITQKKIKKSQILCILFWCFMCIVHIVNIVNSSNAVQYVWFGTRTLLAIIAVCFLFKNSMKCIYLSVFIIFIYNIITCMGIFFRHAFVGNILLPLFGLGITVNYLLKVIEFRKLTDKSEAKPNTAKYRCVGNDIGQQIDVDIVTEQIEMKRMQNMKQNTSVPSGISLNIKDSDSDTY